MSEEQTTGGGVERVPAEVFPLAEYISDELVARGWTTADAAIRMGGATEHQIAIDLLCLDLLMCVHKDNLLVGDRLFAGLSKAFGVSEQYFRAVDDTWRRHPDRRLPFEPPDAIFGPISRRSLIRVVPSPAHASNPAHEGSRAGPSTDT